MLSTLSRFFLPRLTRRRKPRGPRRRCGCWNDTSYASTLLVASTPFHDRPSKNIRSSPCRGAPCLGCKSVEPDAPHRVVRRSLGHYVRSCSSNEVGHSVVGIRLGMDDRESYVAHDLRPHLVPEPTYSATQLLGCLRRTGMQYEVEGFEVLHGGGLAHHDGCLCEFQPERGRPSTRREALSSCEAWDGEAPRPSTHIEVRE